MNFGVLGFGTRGRAEGLAGTLLDALPHPVLLIDVDDHVIEANTAGTVH